MSLHREWAEFIDPRDASRWEIDLTFLASSWKCIYGCGCKGIHGEPVGGCCQAGVFVQVDADDEEGLLLDQLAWFLATCPDPKVRDPMRAVRLAQQATCHTPPSDMTVGSYWHTLGVAYYRAGNWKQTLEVLEKGRELQQSAGSRDWFFQAMAHWRLGNRGEARRYYDLADYGMGWFGPSYQTEELRGLGAEAAKLLELNEKK